MEDARPKAMTKTEIMNAMAEGTGLSKQQVASLFEEMARLIGTSLADNGPGAFTIPGLMKIKVVRKPATPEREGINPFTKEKTTFTAKPARNVVKVTPLKGLKDLV